MSRPGCVSAWKMRSDTVRDVFRRRVSLESTRNYIISEAATFRYTLIGAFVATAGLSFFFSQW